MNRCMKNFDIDERNKDKLIFHFEPTNNQTKKKEVGIIEESIISELTSLISENMKNIPQLCILLLGFFSDKTLCYHRFLIESPLFPQILQNAMSSLPIQLYQLILYLIYDSETLVILSIRQGILLSLFRPFSISSSTNAPLVHISLKILRRMISTGSAARAFIFTSGFFKEMFSFLKLPSAICFPHFQYIIHTFLIFVAGIPSHDYATFTANTYPKRKNIIGLWKTISSSPGPILNELLKHISGKTLEKKFLHSILIITNFLKNGNTFQVNRELWHSLNFFLPIPTYSGPPLTSKTLYYVFSTYSVLAHNPNNIQYFYDLSISKFFKIPIPILLSDPKISVAYFSIIVELIYHSTPKELYFLEKQGIFTIAYQCFSSNNEPLQILSLRILTNALEKSESSILQIISIGGFQFIKNVLHNIDQTSLKLRKEISWFLACILNSLNADARRGILTADLFRFLLDVALSSTHQMGVVTLELFLKFYAENIEVFSSFIKSKEIISDIEELIENGNEQVQVLATKLIKIVQEN